MDKPGAGRQKNHLKFSKLFRDCLFMRRKMNSRGRNSTRSKQSLGMKNMKRTKICKYFSTGSCRLGSKCRFLHVLKEENEPVSLEELKSTLGNTTKILLERKPLLHIIVLYAGDEEVRSYAEEVREIYLNHRINCFLQIQTYPKQYIKPEHLVDIINRSSADYLVVVGDKNMKNRSLQVRLNEKLHERDLEETVKEVEKCFIRRKKEFDIFSKPISKMNINQIHEMIELFSGVKHVDAKIKRINQNVTLLSHSFNSRNEKRKQFVSKFTSIQTNLIRLHQRVSDGLGLISMTPSEKPRRRGLNISDQDLGIGIRKEIKVELVKECKKVIDQIAVIGQRVHSMSSQSSLWTQYYEQVRASGKNHMLSSSTSEDSTDSSMLESLASLQQPSPTNSAGSPPQSSPLSSEPLFENQTMSSSNSSTPTTSSTPPTPHVFPQNWNGNGKLTNHSQVSETEKNQRNVWLNGKMDLKAFESVNEMVGKVQLQQQQLQQRSNQHHQSNIFQTKESSSLFSFAPGGGRMNSLSTSAPSSPFRHRQQPRVPPISIGSSSGGGESHNRRSNSDPTRFMGVGMDRLKKSPDSPSPINTPSNGPPTPNTERQYSRFSNVAGNTNSKKKKSKNNNKSPIWNFPEGGSTILSSSSSSTKGGGNRNSTGSSWQFDERSWSNFQGQESSSLPSDYTFSSSATYRQGQIKGGGGAPEFHNNRGDSSPFGNGGPFSHLTSSNQQTQQRFTRVRQLKIAGKVNKSSKRNSNGSSSLLNNGNRSPASRFHLMNHQHAPYAGLHHHQQNHPHPQTLHQHRQQQQQQSNQRNPQISVRGGSLPNSILGGGISPSSQFMYPPNYGNNGNNNNMYFSRNNKRMGSETTERYHHSTNNNNEMLYDQRRASPPSPPAELLRNNNKSFFPPGFLEGSNSSTMPPPRFLQFELGLNDNNNNERHHHQQQQQQQQQQSHHHRQQRYPSQPRQYSPQDLMDGMGNNDNNYLFQQDLMLESGNNLMQQRHQHHHRREQQQQQRQQRDNNNNKYYNNNNNVIDDDEPGCSVCSKKPVISECSTCSEFKMKGIDVERTVFCSAECQTKSFKSHKRFHLQIMKKYPYLKSTSNF